MRNICLLFCLLLLVNTSFADVDYAKIADNFIDKNVSILKTPGLIVAVVKDGKVVHYRSFGKRNVEQGLPVEKNTLFRIGSLTKTYSATAIMLLREKGMLKLDDPVENYIDELKNIKYPYPSTPLITIRHLVTHSSGLIRHPQPADQTIEGLINEVLDPENGSSFIQDSSGMPWYPGYQYQYSNIGIALLGEVVSRITKMPIYEFIKQEIFLPLEMNDTYWHEDELPEEIRSYSYDLQNDSWKKHQDWDLQGYSAAGSIYSNITDLAKWMNLQFYVSPISSPIILTPFVINEMHRIQVIESSFSNSRGTGIIWYTKVIEGQVQTGHNGATGGYMAYFAFDKKHKVGAIVLASNGQVDTTSFGEQLLANIQKAIKKEEAIRFYPTSEKLLSYLQLKHDSGFDEIFDKSLYEYIGSDQGWVEILSSIKDKYGMVKGIISIEPRNESNAKLILKTNKGILSYAITLSSSEENKLSGLLVTGFSGN